MTTETNTTIETVSETDLKAQYNDYVVECATNGVTPSTFHQWKNRGKVLLPSSLKTDNKEPKEKSISKADIARQIFTEELTKVGGDVTKLVRKDVVKRFQTDPLFASNGLESLTVAGSATYYANNLAAYKKDPSKFGIVNEPATDEVEPEVETPVEPEDEAA